MSDPSSNVTGKTDWTDYQHYWREKDAEWLMYRSLLRYDSETQRSSDLTAAAPAGVATYIAATGRLEFRHGAKWIPLAGAENLLVAPVVGANVNDPVTLYQRGANGLGLVLNKTTISSTLPFNLGVGSFADNLVMKTNSVAASNTVTISTDGGGLVLNDSLKIVGALKRITVPELYVSGPATIANLTAAAVTFPTSLTCNVMVLNTTTTGAAANVAARKDYVDAAVAPKLDTTTAASTYLQVDGGNVVTGLLQVHREAPSDICLRLWSEGGDPSLDFGKGTGTFAQLGYIACKSTGQMDIVCDGDVTINSGGGQVRATDAIYANGQLRAFVEGGGQLLAIGTGHRAYVGFYGNGGSVDSLGTRQGYIGYTSDNYLHINNEGVSSSTFYESGYAHAFTVDSNEAMRILQGVTLLGKTTSDVDVIGTAIFENGAQYITRANDGVALVYLNRTGSPPDGRYWMMFLRNGAGIGGISQNGTTGTQFNTTSDYRQKTVVGPIINAAKRVMSLRPWRVTWNDDPLRGETDAFIAHELDEDMPDAVTGEKDGDEFQMVDYSKPVPLLTAAVQEVISRLERLEARLA